jgi:hypothetical protein
MSSRCPAYIELINTFTFSLGQPKIDPQTNAPLGTVNVKSHNVKYDAENAEVIIPRGVWHARWVMNTGGSSENPTSLTLNVNGAPQMLESYPYTQQIDGIIRGDYLIKATRHRNRVSLFNSGTGLILPGPIPHTTIGSTSIITQLQLWRL